MRNWLRRLRGTIGMGLTWGVVGFLVGMAIEVIHNIWPNPVGAAVDIWPAALAYPGLLGGVAFSTILGIAGRGQPFSWLSIPKCAAWGALGGLVVSLIPSTMVGLGLATANVPIWPLTAALAGPFALGGASAASASIALAQMTSDRESLDAERNVAEAGLSPAEARQLLGADPNNSSQ